MRNIPFCLLLALVLAACDSKPKVIEAESTGAPNNAPIFGDGPAAAAPGANAPVQDMSAAEHKVVVQEALNTDKYTYLRVQENGQEHWIAVTRQDVKPGTTAYYRGGLMKKNFQSKEFNRTFETVFLVGDFRLEGATTSAAGATMPSGSPTVEPPKSVQAAPGAIKIAELVNNKARYENKTVRVTGKVVKMNPMIMGRNWLHLQDGTGKNLDLTVTTTEMVQLGSIVTMEGTFGLNKDFGAGYRYDYIVEAAVLVK